MEKICKKIGLDVDRHTMASVEGGGAHQANEHIDCAKLLECTKTVALMLLRGYVYEDQ